MTEEQHIKMTKAMLGSGLYESCEYIIKMRENLIPSRDHLAKAELIDLLITTDGSPFPHTWTDREQAIESICVSSILKGMRMALDYIEEERSKI